MVIQVERGRVSGLEIHVIAVVDRRLALENLISVAVLRNSQPAGGSIGTGVCPNGLDDLANSAAAVGYFLRDTGSRVVVVA